MVRVSLKHFLFIRGMVALWIISFQRELRRALIFSPCYKVIIVYSKHTNEMCSLNEGLGYSGLCSSRARCPLAPNFCPWATSKSYAGHPRFYSFRALGSLQFSLEHSLEYLCLPLRA